MSVRSDSTSSEKIIIHPRTCSTLVEKKDSLGRVPYEPVKAAVIRQPHVSDIFPRTTAGRGITASPNSSRNSSRYGSQADLRHPSTSHVEEHHYSREVGRQPADGSDSSLAVNLAAGSSRRSHARSSVLEPSNARFLVNDVLWSGLCSSAAESPGSWLNPVAASVGPASPSSQSERLGNAEDMGRLEIELGALKEQLLVQTKVNTDLKKLLVASIGDDLHHKVDALVRTKIQLATEIDDYTKKLVEDYEDLDKMSIQADLWHSKYKASRVLVEQLTLQRDQQSSVMKDAQTALQLMITEHHQLHQFLQLTHRNLEALRGSVTSSDIRELSAVSSVEHTLELAKTNKRLTDEMCLSSLRTLPSHTSSAVSEFSLSPAETHAHKVLDVLYHTSSVSCAGSYPACDRRSLQPRFQPCTRYDGVTYNCCHKCKGEVHLM